MAESRALLRGCSPDHAANIGGLCAPAPRRQTRRRALQADTGECESQRTEVDIVALDDALRDLAKIDAQQSRVVELRFFAGLSIEDTSEVLGISPSTVKRDWNTARVWLYRELDRTAPA